MESRGALRDYFLAKLGHGVGVVLLGRYYIQLAKVHYILCATVAVYKRYFEMNIMTYPGQYHSEFVEFLLCYSFSNVPVLLQKHNLCFNYDDIKFQITQDSKKTLWAASQPQASLKRDKEISIEPYKKSYRYRFLNLDARRRKEWVAGVWYLVPTLFQ